MFCNQCGAEVSEGEAFCPNCGSRLQEDSAQGQNSQRRFCPNCGTENSMEDTFCRECGMPLDAAAYSVSVVGQGMQMNQTPTDFKSKKKKGLIIGICAVAAVLLLAVIVTAVRSLAMGPRGKVFHAVAATMKETPEIVEDFGAFGNILMEDRYTLGFEMEYDKDTVSGELRNTTDEKQISIAADVDGDELNLLCGVHSGVFKASGLDLDYVFVYDPKRENDGYLCGQMRKREVEQLNALIENITSDQVSTKELQQELLTALLRESRELEFKDARAKECRVDGKERECRGYKVRVDEKNIAHFMAYAGEIMAGRMPENAADNFSDNWEDLIEEIEDDDFDTDITFYLYKKKLAAVILEIDDYSDMEWVIEFQGGDYRMQNMLISLQSDADTVGEIEIACRKKGSVETISIESDADITITYNTKSGEVSLEYDENRTACLIEGTYKHSGSEASFTLEEFEVDGDSLVEDEDVGFMIYAKKAVEIERYSGTEFDLGGASEDDFEDLAKDLKESSEIFAPLFSGRSTAGEAAW